MSEFQHAYAIGKAEAAAAMNLLKEVDVRISDKLMQLVKFLVIVFSFEINQRHVFLLHSTAY